MFPLGHHAGAARAHDFCVLGHGANHGAAQASVGEHRSRAVRRAMSAARADLVSLDGSMPGGALAPPVSCPSLARLAPAPPMAPDRPRSRAAADL